MRWTLSKCHEGRWEPRFVWTQDCSMKINEFVRVQQHYLYFLFDLFFVWLQIPWEKFTREPKHGSLTKVVHEKLVIPALQLPGCYLGVRNVQYSWLVSATRIHNSAYAEVVFGVVVFGVVLSKGCIPAYSWRSAFTWEPPRGRNPW